MIDTTSLSAITANLGSITGGTITLSSTGWIKGGQTAYATGTGFFFGYSSGYKLSIGSSTKSLKWDGTNLILTGKIIGPSNFADYAAGNIVVAAANKDTGYLTDTNTYKKVKEISISRGGTLRCKFDVSTEGGSSNAYGRVYRNGTGVGTARIASLSSAWASYSEDISGWTAGDLVQLYIVHGSNVNVAARNFKVCVYASATDTVVLDS